MNVHFSIDNVIMPFNELEREKPDSVFCIPFFAELKKLHEAYNVKFTLYCYYKYEKDGFTIDRVSKKYWDELITTGYIKAGFHGCFNDSDNSDNNVFCNQCRLFYNSVPTELCSSVLRLHRFYGDSERIEFIKKYGIKQLLCRDNRSRTMFNALPSYILNDEEMCMLDNGTLIKDGIEYRKTNAQLELYSCEEFKEHFRTLVCDNKMIQVVIYTHQKILNQDIGLICSALGCMDEYNMNYIF